MKNDIRALKQSYVIDPRTLTNNEKVQLLKIFEEVNDTSFPSITEQIKTRHQAREKIDKAFLEILGFKEEEITSLLAVLYPALHKEILNLKELMAG